MSDTTPQQPNMGGVFPYLALEQADEAIAFYQKAFGAEVMGDIHRTEAGRIMNVTMAINGGVLMMMHHMEMFGPAPANPGGTTTLQLIVTDGDLWWSRAVEAGCEITKPFEKEFWGDRYGRLKDPFGVEWAMNEPSAENLASCGDARTAGDTAEDPAELVLSITRDLAAPRAAVWRCWTEVQLLKQWFCPKPWTVPEADLDLRVGGRMNTTMAGPDGERFENVGIFLEVVPQARLVFTDAYTEGFVPRADSFMTAVVELSDTPDGGTRLVWSARHPTAAKRDQHLAMGFDAGWNAAADQLNALAQTLAQEAAA